MISNFTLEYMIINITIKISQLARQTEKHRKGELDKISEKKTRSDRQGQTDKVRQARSDRQDLSYD